MTKKNMEKRQYKRLFFSKDQNIMATVSLPHHIENTVEVPILNLSEGGIFIRFSQQNKQLATAQKGEHLILKEIRGITPPVRINTTNMEIRWLLKDKLLDHMGFGCEFKDMNEASKKQLHQLIADSGQ